jgi:hypothetical protein
VKVTFSNTTNGLDDAVREDIRGRIYFALSRYTPHIDRVAIQLADADGTPGSSQKICRLSVRMKRLGSFSVESVEQDTMDAVSRAANRAARQGQRILDRRRDETC